jgi:hypothetical protein
MPTGSEIVRKGNADIAKSMSVPDLRVHALGKFWQAGGQIKGGPVLQLEGIGPKPSSLNRLGRVRAFKGINPRPETA